MKKSILVVILLSLWSNAFASYTFTQTFFSSYDRLLDNNFAYKNNDYRDDAKIEKYNRKFSKDDSDNYNCAFDGSGQIRCGDYKIKKPQYSNTDVIKKVKAHYEKLQDIKNVTKGDDFNCALDDKDDVYCWGDGSNGEVVNGEKGHLRHRRKSKLISSLSRLSMARTYTCGVAKQTNQVYCCGKSKKGQANLDSTVPVKI